MIWQLLSLERRSEHLSNCGDGDLATALIGKEEHLSHCGLATPFFWRNIVTVIWQLLSLERRSTCLTVVWQLLSSGGTQ